MHESHHTNKQLPEMTLLFCGKLGHFVHILPKKWPTEANQS